MQNTMPPPPPYQHCHAHPTPQQLMNMRVEADSTASFMYSTPIYANYVDEDAKQKSTTAAGSRRKPSSQNELDRKKRCSRDSRMAKRANQSPNEQSRQREQANNRERDRTESLNSAFTGLRTAVPTQPQDKMSKIHTLKLASMYIEFLSMIKKEPQLLAVYTDKSTPLVTRDPSANDDHIHQAFAAYRMQRGQTFLKERAAEARSMFGGEYDMTAVVYGGYA